MTFKTAIHILMLTKITIVTAPPYPLHRSSESSDEESNFLERLTEFDDSDSDKEEKDSFSFREAFASWAISRNICQNAIDELLSIFRKSGRSLVRTSIKVSLER